MKKIISVLLSLIIFISAQSVFLPSAKAYTHTEITSDKYNSPSVYPAKGEHPRVLFNKNDIADIKNNFSGSENYYAYENFKMLKDDRYTLADLFSLSAGGKVTSVLYGMTPNSEREAILARLEAKAFDYAINGNSENGYEAISGIKEFLNTAVTTLTEDRECGYVIFVSSEIYDWCYNLLTREDIESIVGNLVSLAGKITCKFPPVTSKQNPISGHGAEAMVLRDLYSFSIAVYDEYPDIYEYIQSYLEKEYVEVRNQWYAAHSNHQGSSYGSYRFEFDMWSSWLFRAMSGKELYSPDMQYSLYQILYYITADGQLFPEGDYTPIPTDFTGGRIGNSTAMWLAANYFDDPYLKSEQIRTDLYSTEFDYFEDSKTPVQFLIINNPKLKAGDRAELSKTKYFGYPGGTMIAKTGWESLNSSSGDVTVYMKIGQEYMANHQHLDFGTFQIYYKGMLTTNQGIYKTYASDHDGNYNKETVSHNGLLIYDPNEEQLSADLRIQETVNSGGQRRTYQHPNDYESWKNTDTRYGTVTAWGYDEENSTPAYSYISGDITNAYSDKVSEVRRSMLFMPTDDSAMPAVFFVADKIVSSDASFKKTFLLQAPVMPVISGNTTRIKRVLKNENNNKYIYNGMLTVQTLFPQNPEIVAQGGEGFQWYAGGKNVLPIDPSKNANGTDLIDESNLNYGWGKVLISPSTAQKEDYFLNAMYVSDSGYLKKPVAKALENEDFIGGELVGKVALFAKSSDFLKGEYNLPIEASEKGKEVIVTGLSCGIWEVYENGEYKNEYVIDDESSLIHFTTSGGEIKINYTTLDKPEINAGFIKDSEGNPVVSWKDVQNAIGYRVVVKDKEANTVYSENNLKETTCVIPKNLVPSGKYTVGVTALSVESKFDSPEVSVVINTGYGGGVGNEEFPYIISTEEEFLYLENNCFSDEYYIVTENLDLTKVDFTPFAFSGHISGYNEETQKAEIKNIHYILEYADETSCAGLFTEVGENSYIGYLSVSGSISAAKKIDQAGGFAGRGYKATIYENLVNNVVMSGAVQYGGGILGYGNSQSIKIVNCINNAELSSTNSSSRIAGIVCVISSGAVIKGCVNFGNITGKYNAAGIIAWSYQADISECYNMGDITSSGAAKYNADGILIEGGGVTGGIVGIAKGVPNITNCYNSGTLSAHSSVTVSSAYGGVLDNGGTAKISGYYDAKGYGIADSRVHFSGKTGKLAITYENCYIISDTPSETAGITALSEEQMKKKESFTDFDFDNIWASRPNSSYPYPMLKNNLYDSEVCFDSVSVLSGAGVSKIEILVNLNESIYDRINGTFFGLMAAKLDKGESDITEFGFEINGINKKCDAGKITENGHFGMLVYSATSDEYKIRAYVKYMDGTEEKYKYLECENSLILAMPQ